jgi:hypothetical protein
MNMDIPMDSWITIKEPGIKSFNLPLRLKENFILLMKEELIWCSNLNLVRDIKHKISKDIFELNTPTVLEQKYQRFILSLVAEKYQNIADVNWEDFFKNIEAIPHQSLFHVNQLHYQTVSFAADFLSEVTGNIELKNEIMLSPYSHLGDSFFSSKEYLLVCENLQGYIKKRYIDFIAIERVVKDMAAPVTLSINCKALLKTTLVKDCLPKYKELFEELTRQELIYPGYMVNYDFKEVPLLEYYISLPNDNFYNMALYLLQNFDEDINAQQFLNYFEQDAKKIMGVDNFEHEKNNLINMLAVFKKKELFEKLSIQLPNKEEPKGSSGKGKI